MGTVYPKVLAALLEQSAVVRRHVEPAHLKMDKSKGMDKNLLSKEYALSSLLVLEPSRPSKHCVW
eukprot:scaffold362185_cov33-Prasinocladus_malaysianus.AAC.2